MKLEIDAIQVDGDAEMILPAYMQSLPQRDIDIIRKNCDRDRIIACGYHKQLHNFTLINDEGSIREVDAASFFQHFIIIDHAIPIDGGKKVEVHTPLMIIEVDSTDLLSSSKPVNTSDFEIDMKS